MEKALSKAIFSVFIHPTSSFVVQTCIRCIAMYLEISPPLHVNVDELLMTISSLDNC